MQIFGCIGRVFKYSRVMNAWVREVLSRIADCYLESFTPLGRCADILIRLGDPILKKDIHVNSLNTKKCNWQLIWNLFNIRIDKGEVKCVAVWEACIHDHYCLSSCCHLNEFSNSSESKLTTDANIFQALGGRVSIVYKLWTHLLCNL